MRNKNKWVILEDAQTGESIKAVIEPVIQDDFKMISKDKYRFNAFSWNKYKGREVYKLRLLTDQVIVGLICLKDFPPEQGVNALEIELLEVSAENREAGKKLNGIAGCLIAFACRESFKRGYEGWIFLVPKTYLVEHYVAMYGFEYIPLKISGRPAGFLELNTSNSFQLIKKFPEKIA